MAPVVLVTGGTGFLGSHLCDRLVREGCVVHATSRHQVKSGNGTEFHVADFADLDAARKIVETVEPNIIFHLAGAIGAGPDIRGLVPAFESHVASTVNLLSLAALYGVKRVVLTGSLLEPIGGEPATSPYAAAKQAAYVYARMAHELYGMPVVTVRPFMTYGPAQNSSKFIPYVINRLLRCEAPEISSGNWRADWIYVTDVIEGMMAAAMADVATSNQLDLGSGKLHSLRDIAEIIRGHLETDVKVKYGAVPDRPKEPERIANISYTSKLLSWQPRVDILEGLRRTIEWYKSST